jgi:AraC family transcriptional regulator
MEVHMNNLEKLNAALRYIDENLDGTIDYRVVAGRANCSEYHFKRVFSFLAGLPLSEYIRRRRLTLAAADLRDKSQRVLDVAVKYGYDSADSFARAFASLHGITPGQVRHGGQATQSYSPLTFQLSIHGGFTMEYRIVKKDQFCIIGHRKRVKMQFNGVNPEIAAMWETLDADQITRLKSINNLEPSGMISASINFSEDRMEEQGELDHYIGVASTLPSPEEFQSLKVAAGTWAIFSSEGLFPDTLQKTWGRIYSEWLPSTDYEVVEGPEILLIEQMTHNNTRCKSEIWIPVRYLE